MLYREVEEKVKLHEAQLAEKAQKTEVDVERKRIDNLAKLEQGSTTGDAELIDARIGANGKSYGNVGSAIREQFSNVNDNLVSSTKELQDVSLKIGEYEPNVIAGYISTDGSFKESSGEYGRTNLIPVGNGLKVYYKGFGVEGTTAIYGYNENKEPIGEILVRQPSTKEYTIDVDSTYAYIAMCSRKDVAVFKITALNSIKSEISSIYGDIESLDNRLKSSYEPSVVVGYVALNGSFQASSGEYCRTDYLPVGNGLKVYYKGYGVSGTTAIYGYDKNKLPLGEILTRQAVTAEHTIYIDTKYAYIAMCSLQSVHKFTVMQEDSVDYIINKIAKPGKGVVIKVGNDAVSRAKATCYKTNEHFVITYGENLDGGTNDFPTESGSGTLAMKYKKFDLIDGVESNVSFGTFAQKGMNYIDINGQTQIMPGGCGLPMGTNIGKMQYFSTAKQDGVYVPMCCSVTLLSDGSLNFGDIRQLSLTIDGSKGEFDFHRNNMFADTYYTTATPFLHGTTWHWCQVVKNGFAYLTSSNGYDWVLVKVFATEWQPRAEISCVKTTTALFASLRIKGIGNKDTEAILVYIANEDLIGTSNSSIRYYHFPALSTRSILQVINDRRLLYMFNDEENNKMSVYVVCDNLKGNGDNDGIHYFKWFDIYNRTVWYASFCDTDIKQSKMPSTLHLVGNNSKNETTAMYFTELNVNVLLPNVANDITEFLIK